MNTESKRMRNYDLDLCNKMAQAAVTTLRMRSGLAPARQKCTAFTY